MSVNRSFTILIKDIYWTLSNLKIATLLIVPLVISILFNEISVGILASVAYSFTISFIGIFITALSVIEEKRNDTLFCLLTTPLRGSEFIFGKITTSLILCFIFCLISSFLGGKQSEFLSIYFILNLLLFSFAASSLGCFLGLICKNEQVLSILVTPIMMIFAMGTLLSDLVFTNIQSSFLPDYHFIKSIGVTDNLKAFKHMGFNFLTSVVFLSMTVSYVKFYFKYGREKVLNKLIFLQILTLIIPFLISGFTFVTDRESINDELGSKEDVVLNGEFWKIHVKQNKFKIGMLMKNELMTQYTVKFENDDSDFKVLFKKPKKLMESSQLLRNTSFRKRHKVLFYEMVPIKKVNFDKWVYTIKSETIMLYELYNKEEILIITMKSKTSEISDLFDMKNKMESFITNLKIKPTLPE
jgi:hypothetical protein